MSQTLTKRGREPEDLLASTDVQKPKRFHGEETDRFCHLLQEEEECAPSEEVVNGIMRSLEEEISATCFTSYVSTNSGDNSASSDISSGQEGETLASISDIDLFYLLEASDDELTGIPLSPVLDFTDEVRQSPKATAEGLLENSDLTSFDEIWHFDDNFQNYQQFALHEDAREESELQDYLNGDFVSQDGDFSAAWTLETASCL